MQSSASAALLAVAAVYYRRRPAHKDEHRRCHSNHSRVARLIENPYTIGVVAETDVFLRMWSGEVTGAKADAGKARELLEARLREHPNDFRSLKALGWIYLAPNRKIDAINTARRAIELLPLEKDAVLGSGNLAALAEIQVLPQKSFRI